MAANMAVKMPVRAFEGNEVFEVPDACKAKIGIGAGMEPPVKPACSEPFVKAMISSSAPLNPVMKERNWGGMDNA